MQRIQITFLCHLKTEPFMGKALRRKVSLAGRGRRASGWDQPSDLLQLEENVRGAHAAILTMFDAKISLSASLSAGEKISTVRLPEQPQ